MRDTNSPAEPRGEAGGGQLDSIGGKEDSHAGHNDTGAKVLYGLDGRESLIFEDFFTSTTKIGPILKTKTALKTAQRNEQ